MVIALQKKQPVLNRFAAKWIAVKKTATNSSWGEIWSNAPSLTGVCHSIN